MSDPGGGLGADRPGQSDPAAGLVAALASLVGQGLAAWGTAAETLFSAAGRGPQTPQDPLGTIADMAAVAGTALPGLARLAGRAEEGQAAFAQVADLSPAIAQACMVAAASALRYGRTIAEIMGRHQAGLLQAAMERGAGETAADPSAQRALADDLRAYLREIGDAAAQEARRLQHELEMVGESIAVVIDEATSPPHASSRPHPRRHQVKE